MSKTTEKFWISRKTYPPVTCNLERRYLDLGLILKYLNNYDSILDLGCGEGQILLMLRELTDIKKFYAFDLTSVFIDNLIKKWGTWPGLDAKTINFSKINELPRTDICICMGVMLYLSDVLLREIISKISSKLFIIRVPCTLRKDRLEIDKFSEEYQFQYAATYRTIPEYISILSEFFEILTIDRCYPDSIESKYESKQFLFVCKKKGKKL
jgi:SAM-dependent methyltransferase